MASLLKFNLSFSQSKTLATKIAIAMLCLSSPLLLTNSSLAQNTREPSTGTIVETNVNTKSDLGKINTALERFSASNADYEQKKQAIAALQGYLKNPDKQLRIDAAKALGTIGRGADAAIPDLKTLLRKERDKDVLSSVIAAIKSIDAKPAIEELIVIFQNQKQDLQVRSLAASALGTFGGAKEVKPVIPSLLQSLEKDRGLDKLSLRISVAEALSRMYDNLLDDDVKPIPVLTKALQDPSWEVRGYAFRTLGARGRYSKDAIPQVIEAYKKELNITARQKGVRALGEIGKRIDGKTLHKEGILDLLIETLGEKDEQNGDLHSFAALSINEISGRFLDEAKNNKLQTQDANYLIQKLDEALYHLNKLEPEEKKPLTTTIQNIEASYQELKQRQLINQIIKNPSFWLITTYLILLGGLFTLRPVWLLKIDLALKSVGSFKLPVVDKEVSLSWLLLMLKYHPRVLDAWVEEHIKPVQEAFHQKDTVRDRDVYIPIPVIQNGRNIAQLTSKDLRSTFNKKQARLLIQGEGGVGKTSLACQIAKWGMSEDKNLRLCKHRMLPVLIEDELVIEQEIDSKAGVANQKSPYPYIPSLIKAIRGQLQYLTDEMELISEELLEHLLRERRILVIVDHLSEMNEDTRKAIRPDIAEFPVNALIVTSRSEEKLGHVIKTTINPMRIQGNRLSSFMEAYLTQANKRDLFTDPEFFHACSRLSQMVGERNVTALLAKLYADQLIVAKVEEVQQLPLVTPENIPELMLWYLNVLNRSVSEDRKLSDRTVQQDAKVIAWECLKDNFKPTYAKRDVALSALGGENAEIRLNYLEKCLNIIQTFGADQNKIRFGLDPLAEYLAAMHLLELCQENQYLWSDFWYQQITTADDLNSSVGFLLALRDCYQALSQEADIPPYITKELSQLPDSGSNTPYLANKVSSK